MKVLTYLIAAVLIASSGVGAFRIYQMTQHSIVVPTSESIGSFDPEQNLISGVPQINQRMREMIIQFKKEEKQNKSLSILFNVGVTLFTAVAAFLASITAVRALTKRNSTIAVAVLTFLSTLFNTAQSHFSQQREDVASKTEKVKTYRKELEAIAALELPKHLEHYNNELDDLQ